MKTSTVLWVIIVLIIIVGGGWYWHNRSASAPAPSGQGPVADSQNLPVESAPARGTDTQAAQNAPMTATVVYGPKGFSPSTVTIGKGGTVQFVNQGRDEMWIASNPHPTHEGYSGTTRDAHCPDAAGVAFDQCSVGAHYSFTFQKVGTWEYHNHGNASDRGVVIVK